MSKQTLAVYPPAASNAGFSTLESPPMPTSPAQRSMKEDDPLDDFTGRAITLDGVCKKVYVTGSGPAVIVMTEMPGISPQVARFSHQMGFDKPMLERLGHFVMRALHGDFGTSYWQNEPAAHVVLSRVPAELLLIGGAMFVAYVFSLVLGVVAARRAGGCRPGRGGAPRRRRRGAGRSAHPRPR